MTPAANKRWSAVLVALSSALAGFVSARCERPNVVSVFPPMDVCCQCLATQETSRGARCSRGSVTDCVQDMERLDILGSETNLRCLRTVCSNECGFLAPLLPPEEDTRDCCQCLANNKQDGVTCYNGSTEECVTEIEEGEPNRILQGAGLCLDGVCKDACEALFGNQDQPDAAMEEPDAGGGDGGQPGDGGLDSGFLPPPLDAGARDVGNGPFLPFDGGCPSRFPCF
jgi:hypothetical protein